jgi:predicted nucleotidyltransferase
MKRAAVQEKPVQPMEWERLRPEVTPELLADITQRIVDAFHPYKVILFGSYAYGTPHKESDLDLFVLMDSAESMPSRMTRVYQVAEAPFLSMDVLVFTPAELQARLEAGDQFYFDLLARGKMLYDRDSR